MTEDQRRALIPLLSKLGPMLEVFSELEEGDASHYAPALHLGLTEWRRIKEAFQPLLAWPDHISCRRKRSRTRGATFGIADSVPLLRCAGGHAAPIGERRQRSAHAGCRRRLRPRSRRSDVIARLRQSGLFARQILRCVPLRRSTPPEQSVRSEPILPLAQSAPRESECRDHQADDPCSRDGIGFTMVGSR
jgi:hypothetical protein